MAGVTTRRPEPDAGADVAAGVGAEGDAGAPTPTGRAEVNPINLLTAEPLAAAVCAPGG